jgi:hypothetical protein
MISHPIPTNAEEKAVRIILILTLWLPLGLAAQQDDTTQAPAGPCEAAEYRQFDFWIGNWEVSAQGKPAGTNSIHAVHGGCALQENWQGAGAGGISGSSFNIFDRSTGKWHQTWVDASGTLLLLDGSLVDGVMVLEGSRPTASGGTAQHRISWTPNEDGSVRQLWEASNDGGGSWNVLFDGLYVKSTGQP